MGRCGVTRRAPDPTVPHPSEEVAAALLDRLEGLAPRLGGGHLVLLDGVAGAGKTTLAAAIVTRALQEGTFGDRARIGVVHMDDLYEGWGGLLAAGEQLASDVVGPLRAGLPGHYRRYDWVRAERNERVEVAPADLLVIEGCGAAPPLLDDVASLVCYVTAPDALRLARGLARDGEALRPQWLAFMADEERLAERDRTRERAHVVIGAHGQVLRW